MRTVTVSTRLEADPDIVWGAVKTPHAFRYITKGALRYPAAAALDRPWREGDDVVGWTFLLGFVPVSRHRLRVESIDDERRILLTEEGGGLIRAWHHRLHVSRNESGGTDYEDRIDIDAGRLTAVVAGFAEVFYRYRQRRWRGLARLLAASQDDVPTRRPAAPHIAAERVTVAT